MITTATMTPDDAPYERGFAVDVLNRPREVFATAREALAYARAAVYLSDEGRRRATDALANGYRVDWAYGFGEVTIYPPARAIRP